MSTASSLPGDVSVGATARSVAVAPGGTEDATGPRTTDRRADVMRAALELFARRTYGATAMPAIAEKAKVGTGTLYRHFENKEDLGNAVFREAKGAMHRYLLEALAKSDGDARQRFVALWRGLADFAADHPDAMRFLELQHHEEYLDDESRRVRDALIADAERFLRAGQAEGAVRDEDPRLLLGLVFGAFVGMMKDSCLGRFEVDDATVARSAECAWRLLSA